MKKEEPIYPLLELAVWGILSRKTDMELIVLKGHLLLDNILSIYFSNRLGNSHNTFSFFKKIQIFKELDFNNVIKQEFIVASLTDLNLVRNGLAHETLFNIHDSNIINWSEGIHKELKGDKFSKYTKRTKLVHAFSLLAINILEMDTLEYRMISQINDTTKPTPLPVALLPDGEAPLLSS